MPRSTGSPTTLPQPLPQGRGAKPAALRTVARLHASFGFTLLEILLAVAVTGMLAAVLFGGLGIVFDTRAAAESELRGQRDTAVALRIIRDQLLCVLPPSGELADEFIGEDLSSGSADVDRLTFFTTSIAVPTGQPRGDTHQVVLGLVDADDQTYGPTHYLVQQVTDDLISTVTPTPVSQVLLRGVSSLELRYFDGTDWVDEWDSREEDDVLPEAIELTIERQPTEVEADADEDSELLPRRLVSVFKLPSYVASQPSQNQDSEEGGDE